MLTMTNIWAGYGGSHVLQGVDLHCAPGTITCIVGPNGAGKSTVLRVVSGLLSPARGRSSSTAPRSPGVPPTRSCGRASHRCRSRTRCSPR